MLTKMEHNPDNKSDLNNYRLVVGWPTGQRCCELFHRAEKNNFEKFQLKTEMILPNILSLFYVQKSAL